MPSYLSKFVPGSTKAAIALALAAIGSLSLSLIPAQAQANKKAVCTVSFPNRSFPVYTKLECNGWNFRCTTWDTSCSVSWL